MRAILSSIGLAVALAFASFAIAQPAVAQGQPIDGYCTDISDNDKVASDGFALTDAGSILRQDRANYHRFGVADIDDLGDNTFTTSKAREAIPAMLDAGNLDPAVADEIVNFYPYVCVDIYRDALTVYVTDPQMFNDDYPFVGSWDCEIAIMSFTAETYDSGSGAIPIEEIQQGSDGSWTLMFKDDYWITLSGFTGSEMGWFSGASGDSFNCARLD
ncbi:MAG: hypothetical protein WBA73_03945 [Devosia sp.]